MKKPSKSAWARGMGLNTLPLVLQESYYSHSIIWWYGPSRYNNGKFESKSPCVAFRASHCYILEARGTRAKHWVLWCPQSWIWRPYFKACNHNKYDKHPVVLACGNERQVIGCFIFHMCHWGHVYTKAIRLWLLRYLGFVLVESVMGPHFSFTLG